MGFGGSIIGGILAGLALGMLGAGGTVIGLPMLLYVGGLHGHNVFGTNATGVAAVAFLLLSWRIWRREIRLGLGVLFTVPGLAGIAIGDRLGLVFPGHKLVFLLGFLLLVVAGWIGYLSTRPDPPAAGAARVPAVQREQVPVPAVERERVRDPRPSAGGAHGGAAAGGGSAPMGRRRLALRVVPTAFVTGLISGFFAIGGGFLIVPGLAIAARVDLRESARSSLVPIAAFAGLDALEYSLAGDVSLVLAGVMLAAGVVAGAAGIMLGDRLSLRLIQRVFAGFLVVVAVYMILKHFI